MSALDQIVEQLKDAEKDTNQFLDINMEEFVFFALIPEIKSVARAANLPEEFIDGIRFVKTDPNMGKIINVWGSAEKPFAKWFNDGTNDHFIAPTNKKALHWITLLGRDAFSKGHMVRGLPQTLAMEIGLFLGRKKLQEFIMEKRRNELTEVR